jgi:glycosyltransferase involved in cell wall biosynthesis
LYYVLPGIGIYGGVKKGFQAADILAARGFPCAVATPEGACPGWFETGAEVISRRELERSCREEDTVLFSFPPDADFVDSLSAARRIVHMQGANTPADRELFARDFEFISHGLHMTEQLLLSGRTAPYVPIGVSDAFRWRGERKREASVVLLSRKGSKYVDAVADAVPPGGLEVVDGITESELAELFKQTDLFVAISPVEAFGLPPLEAMCAGCCVVGFPGDGGFEFMRHGETAHVVPNGDTEALAAAVARALARPRYRDTLRSQALELSRYYTLEREGDYLVRALGLVEE